VARLTTPLSIGNLVEKSLHENAPLSAADEAWDSEYHILLKQNMLGYVERGLLADLSQLAAAAAEPPSNNMGVSYPSTPQNISHSEKTGVKVSQKTSIDWLGFSTLAPLEGILIGLQILWPDLIMSASKAGMRGYSKCKALFIGEVQYGLVGYGAKHGRASISLTGTACKTLTTPEQFETVRGLLDVLDARLSRVDLCFDFYRGEVRFEGALWAYQNGDFKPAKAKQNPQKKIVESTGPDGENLGRTLYIGPRDGDKYGRIYEKGLEVFAKMPQEYREACTERELEQRGDTPVTTIADDWLRLEVEFKRVHKDRPIPLEIILERDLYFAGAYPFYAWALGMGEGMGRKGIRSDSQLSHDKLIMAHRASYGNHVHSLRRIGFTDSEIVNMLDTGIHNQKLLKSGLVDVEQQAVRNFRQSDGDSDIPF
jgi:DNA relaxase NicK